MVRPNSSTDHLVVPIRETGEGLDELASRYRADGYVVVSIEDSESVRAALGWVSQALRLGDPYVPLLYRHEGAEAHRSDFADITTSADTSHPGFGTTQAQAVHVDGLLDPLGAIRTTVLFCVRDGIAGGSTLLFDTCRAFRELATHDRAAAETLLENDVLERLSSLQGVSQQSSRGPAFAVDPEGQVTTRFSDGPTERWHPPEGRATELARALAYIRSRCESPELQQRIRLRPRECLIFANDRWSHGREEYRDTPQHRRHLVRALYSATPSLSAEEDYEISRS